MTPATRAGCLKPHTTCPWTLPGIGHPQLLWATTSMSLTMFNRAVPSTDPWGTPLVTGLHLGIKSSIKSLSFHFREKDVVQRNVKCFTQVQLEGVSHSSIIYQYCNSVIDICCRICETPFALGEAMLAVTNLSCLFSLSLPGTSAPWICQA